MSLRLVSAALLGVMVMMTVSVQAEPAKKSIMPMTKPAAHHSAAAKQGVVAKKLAVKKVATAKPQLKVTKALPKPQPKMATKPLPVGIKPANATISAKPLVATPVMGIPKAPDNARLVEVDGYRWMLPNVFAIPQHEVMQIPADAEKTSAEKTTLVPLSMYSFSTPTSDQAFMSSFNSADLKGMPPAQLKKVLESSKNSYIKTMNAPEEFNSRFTTVQGHQAIVFDVKETTKSGTIFYSKVIGLLKPGGFYQFAFVSHQQDDLAQPWVQQVFDSIQFANETR